MTECYRVLSLDGGGIRGLLTAVMLQELESKLGAEENLHAKFDLIAGTSTGSLLACAIGLAKPIETIIDLYVNRGKEVFPTGAGMLWQKTRRVFSEGISSPRYDGSGLGRVLDDEFGSAKLGDLATDTLIMSYNILTRQAKPFKSYDDEDKNLLIKDVCMASCSAPAYFPPHQIKIKNRLEPFIDGGVVANNPSSCAIAEGLCLGEKRGRHVDLKNFILASFGTGESTRAIEFSDAKEWGALEWAVPIIDVLFDGSQDAVHYIARQLLQNGSYFRFQPRLEDAYDDLDEVSRTNLNALQVVAANYMKGSAVSDRIRGLASQLKTKCHTAVAVTE